MDAWSQAQGRPDERLSDAPTKPALSRCGRDRGRPTLAGMWQPVGPRRRASRGIRDSSRPLAARPLVAVRGVT